MKLQKLLLGFLAAGVLFVSCKEKEEPEPALPFLNVSPTELTFDQGGGNLSITVNANRPWSISSDADWLAFNPSSGAASDAPVTVAVTALANTSNDRASSFKVKTDFDFKTISVSQAGSKGEDPNTTATGSGTANDPYNVVAALEKAKTLTAYNSGDDLGSENSITVYTKGIVSSVEIDPSYGNATYYISTDGTSENTLEVYRGKYFDGANFLTKDQLKVGDEVVVSGTIVNFKGNTPEYTTGSKIISINGNTVAPAIDFTKFELLTVKAFIDKADNGQFFRLKGKVSKFSKQYCSFDLTDDSGTIYVYNVNNKDEWSDKISNNGTVELAGLYTYYEKNSQHEVVSAQILSFEAGSGSVEGDPKGSGTLADPYNPAGAAAAVKSLTWTDKDNYQTTEEVYVKGKICKIADKGTFTDGGTYGNASFYISEDGEGEGEFYVYRTLYLGNKKFESGQTDIKVGDEVVIYGKLMNYRGNTPETVAGSCYLYSLNGQSEGGDQPGGETEEVKNATVAEFIAAQDSETQPYKLVGKVSNIKSDVYGNFDLTDETGTVYIYGLVAKDLGGYAKNKANDKSFKSIGIKEGDKITIVTFRDDYTNSSGETTIEGVGGYYVSGASGEGGGSQGGDSGSIVTGNTETLDFSAKGYENAQDIPSVEGKNFKITFDNGTNKNGPKYYNTGTAVRVYGSNNFTITSSKTITAIKFTFSSGEGTNEITADKGTYSDGSWTGSATSVKFTIGGTSGHRRIKAIAVTFAE